MPRFTSYALACLMAFAFVGCDSAGSEDFSSLLHGTWNRTDEGVIGEAMRFLEDRTYEILNNGQVVETGVFVTMDGDGTTFGVRYFGEKKSRGDEKIELRDNTLIVTSSSGARTYSRQ
jgi:hypothetical protein